MIVGLIHPGSGIGNQLHRYVMTRTLALQKGYKWGMAGWENWKADFIKVDRGEEVPYKTHVEIPAGKLVVEGLPLWEEKTKYYNPEINFIEDNTVIDGEFQDERYFLDPPNFSQWLETKKIKVPDDLCVIGFRGGEFTVFPELFLTKEYWDKGIKMMKEINPKMRFEVHTDDPLTAASFFPDYEVIHFPEINWRTIREARYAIIANSSFFIFPRLLQHLDFCCWNYDGTGPVTIAPRYWARHNVGYWEMPQNYYKTFFYI